MSMELTDSLKTLLIETAKSLKGSARRLFMARTVKELGPGGQQRAARELRWWAVVSDRFAHLTTLAINLDNGPENHSRRTQFMQRMVDFAHHTGLTVRLAYYPPYHSKYNPIERCWGILENHWNGALLDSIDTVIQFATTMTWKGKCPVVELVTTTYQTGVKLTKEAMQMVEAQLQRLPGLDKWFVDIVPTSAIIRAT
jgi:hypothetical protein